MVNDIYKKLLTDGVDMLVNGGKLQLKYGKNGFWVNITKGVVAKNYNLSRELTEELLKQTLDALEPQPEEPLDIEDITPDGE